MLLLLVINIPVALIVTYFLSAAQRSLILKRFSFSLNCYF